MALTTNEEGIQLRMVEPDYLYHYPCFRRVKLAAVKHQMMHPNLPSFRQLERDSLLHKLADEHSRTTTSCSSRDFREVSMNPLNRAAREFHCLECTETGHALRKKYFTPLDVQRQGLIWQRHLNNPMVAAGLKNRQDPLVQPRPVRDKNCGCVGAKNLQFDGVPLRYIKADLRNWRFTFKDEPRLVDGSQQPVPSDRIFPRDIKPHPNSIRSNCKK